MIERGTSLYDFAFHHRFWLRDLRRNLREEPWGGDRLRILEIYLIGNFEIAVSQNAVFEDSHIAFWKAGHLMTPSMDEVWMFYKKNDPGYSQPWRFEGVRFGKRPFNTIDTAGCQFSYESLTLHEDWNLYVEPRNLYHILVDRQERLGSILGKEIAQQPHFLFRAIYGELHLQFREAGGILLQWYRGSYSFLAPLYLSQPDAPDLCAALTIDEEGQRYHLRTLLSLEQAYANARSVVLSRSQLPAWATISPAILNADFRAVDDEDCEQKGGVLPLKFPYRQ